MSKRLRPGDDPSSRGGALRVGVAQIATIPGDIDANIDRHLQAMAVARERGADVLLFPELSLTGHGAGGETLQLARRRDGRVITRLGAAAGDLRVIVGFIEEGPAAQFYNSAVIVQNGAMRFLHRKINIATYGALEEGKHYATGRYVETFELDERWRAGLLICADAWNPALVYLTALHGATILFVPISSAVEALGAEFDNPGGWDTTLRFYAQVYGLPVVMTNRVGCEDGLTFWGGSRILDPFGRELARAGDREEMLIADLSYEQVREARYRLPTVRDSNLALIVREIQRLADIVGVPESIRKL